jgi:hypothetical protein
VHFDSGELKMARPLVLIHGYSAEGKDFEPLCKALKGKDLDPIDLNICNYISLNNEITIKDIAEGLDRAFRMHGTLQNENQEFDAIVHSTGMLVIRSWLTNYGAAVRDNTRLKRLKHLIGLAPATWGSPQAHKGRTWLGALVKGNRELGPDFFNAGDQVLDGLELGSRLTWDLAHLDLLGPQPYYDKGPDTPYVCVFIGNQPYTGLASVANDPGTDGTVRWAGCALNTRKITIDLTRRTVGANGQSGKRLTISPWADDRLEIPMIPVDGRNHASLISNPDPDMVQLIREFLKVGEKDGPTFEDWLRSTEKLRQRSIGKMLTNPTRGQNLEEGVKTFYGHLFGDGGELDGWQQFIVRAKDERGDPVTDYLIEVLRPTGPDTWEPFEEMYTSVHAYSTDPSYRCFHVRLPKGITQEGESLRIRFNASTGTELIVYQGYQSETDGKVLQAEAKPVELGVKDLGKDAGSLFHPFTTTLIEIIVNREPAPLNQVSRIMRFLPAIVTEES